MNNTIVGLIRRNKLLFENFSYISLLQLFIIVSPLITYPYLIGVLGKELYGWIVTTQVLNSYACIFINFGTDSVCARFVSVSRDNNRELSQIVSAVLVGKLVLWLFTTIVCVSIILAIPSYREHWLVFLLAYGQTLESVLFPQYFFQGVEKMKISSVLNICVKLVFILLIFLTVKSTNDYLLVPTFYSIGFFFAGLISIYIIKRSYNIKFYFPPRKTVLYYLKESSPLFATDLICTIKDKLNYFFLGAISMGDMVIYDFGVKITAMLSKPCTVIATVVFPRLSKTRNVNMFKRILLLSLIAVIGLTLVANIFLSDITMFMLHEKIDLLPLRIFTLAPIFLTVSSFICSNCYIAFGFNKYTLYSILVTTAGYLCLLLVMIITNNMNSLYAFVLLAVASYFIEMVYRLITCRKLLKLVK